MYKVADIKPSEVFTTYPALETIYNEAVEIHKTAQTGVPCHAEPLTPQELMTFIVYVYHLHSPLVRENSIHKRRRQALERVGHETNDKSSEALLHLIIGANEFVNRLALIFCKYENSVAWTELCSIQDILDDVFLTLKVESEGTEKKSANEMLKIKLEVNAKAEGLRTKMRQLSTELFIGDNALLNLSASQILLEERKKIITPERFVAAQKEKNGKK